ncbi:MAG TPA: V-type ATP synthase subunit D [Gemmatimonadaceae bacterium]|nr:V-type ATP synthase subunit D [Gemmatimonadaceae bacterium]
MNTRERVSSTRAGWLQTRRALGRVQRGAELTRRKREALVAELFRSARPAVDARQRLVEAGVEATEALVAALSVHGSTGLAPLAWPSREPLVEMRSASVWGIPVSEIVECPSLARTLDARQTAPTLLGLSGSTAALRYERLTELLIEAGPGEQRMQRIGDAVAATTRRLRTLEQRVVPALRRQVAAVRRELDEREREDRVRLRRMLRGRTGPPG